MIAPLFVKYRTKHDKNYLYDCGTGRIIEVDGVIYAIVDDFRFLTDLEILVKYAALGLENVRRALEELYAVTQKGCLSDHPPAELCRVDVVSYCRRKEKIATFWERTAGLLILGITERCNLCCAYCCFSGGFTGHRLHSQRSMSWEVAEKAIRFFLENDQAGDGSCSISFYGGEALLEFSLLKRCVAFAKIKAELLGKKVRFAITTNGTLLNDEVVDFLMENGFLVLVSLDGPKAAHDRYRVFADGQGSFDLIHGNLRRFAERYPGYHYRGLNVILAPPFDLETTAGFIESFFDEYPLTRVAMVNTGMEDRFPGAITTATQYGCYSTALCQKNLDVSADKPVDIFRRFTREDHEQLMERWKSCMESIARFGVTRSRERMRFNMLLFEQQINFYHSRNVSRSSPDWYFFIPCVPGLTRRFCDVDGNYRVCERVDDSETYRLGNVWDGPDAKRLERTMELRRHFGDCANCTALKTCDVCYARIPETDAVDRGYDPQFDLQCRRTRQVQRRMLQTYTEIMEVNPDAFDLVAKDLPQSPKMKFGSLDCRQDESLLAQLECEKTTVNENQR